jgi:phosphate-selective porin OprO/OprP
MFIRSVSRALAIALGLAAGAISSSAVAQDLTGEVDLNQIYRFMQQQDQRIKSLENQLQQTQQPMQLLPAVVETNNSMLRRISALESATANLQDDDEGVDTHGEKFSVKVGGRAQADTVWYANDPDGVGAQNYFEFRRLRLFAEGEGYGVFDYKVQLDFLDDSTGGTAMKDVYIGMHDVPGFGWVQMGHFKVPFGLETLTSSKYITFMERSLPVAFAPEREVGIGASNNSADEYVTWSYGAFFDDISELTKEIVDDNQGIRIAGRATWTPYYDELAEGRYLFHLGMAGMYTNDRDNDVEFESRPETHEGVSGGFVSTGSIAADDYTSLGLEAAVVSGPLSLQSEFMYVDVDADSGADLDYYGAYAFVSYFFTGEHRKYDRSNGTFGRVSPLENFWIVDTAGGRCVGRGAWEGAIRWSYLDFTDSADEDQLHDITLGVNWYWNPYMRMMFEYIHAFRDSPGQGDADLDILGTRLQVDF